MSKTVAQCGFNFRSMVEDSSDWSDLTKHLMDPLWLLEKNRCAFDEVLGKSQQQIDALSAESLLDSSPLLQTRFGKWNRPPEWQASHCLGSLDWAWLLVPDPSHHFVTPEDKWEQQMKRDKYNQKQR